MKQEEALSTGANCAVGPTRELLLLYSSPLAASEEAAEVPMSAKPHLMERVTERQAYEFPPDGLPSGTCENQNTPPQGRNWASKSKAQRTRAQGNVKFQTDSEGPSPAQDTFQKSPSSSGPGPCLPQRTFTGWAITLAPQPGKAF